VPKKYTIQKCKKYAKVLEIKQKPKVLTLSVFVLSGGEGGIRKLLYIPKPLQLQGFGALISKS
jgi:hypothetical protein